jgi:glycosyltransferase involved in cell wall biosynthesis
LTHNDAAMRIGISGAGGGLGQRGGVQVYLRDLLVALSEGDGGHEYVVFVPRGEEPPPVPGTPRISVAHLAAPLPRRQPLRDLARLALDRSPPRDGLAEEIDALGLDVVHWATTRGPVLALKTPAALTFFDMQEAFFPGFFPLRERIGREVAHRRGVRAARLVLVPSLFTAESLTTRYRTAAGKIVLAPVGVGDRFQPEADAEERARLDQRYGLPQGDFLVYPANPWPHKNHGRLMAALALLRRDRALVAPLVCTGRLAGEQRSAATLARAAGLPSDQVRDVGFVPEGDMPALYRAARGLVFPSLFEGFGMPVLEAMACGCPVACARAAALPEVGGDAVRYFDPTRTDDIARAVGELWTDGALRADLRGRGLARAESYRWRRVIPQVLEGYERLR